MDVCGPRLKPSYAPRPQHNSRFCTASVASAHWPPHQMRTFRNAARGGKARGRLPRARERKPRVRVISRMRVFLDFEASSLADDSYPIEIGWAAEDGSAEAHLIRPAPAWSDWDPAAQAMHGLTRARLCDEGEPHDQVALRTLAALAGHDLFASAPSWDGKWMSVLLRSAGLPRHALRLKDSDEAHRETVRELLQGRVPDAAIAVIAGDLIAAARGEVAVGPPRHRALADAQVELDVWRAVRRLGLAEARRRGG